MENVLVSVEPSSRSSLWVVPARGIEPCCKSTFLKQPKPVRLSLDGKAPAFLHEQSKAEVRALKNSVPGR